MKRNKTKKSTTIKVLIPVRKPAKLADTMACCKAGSPAPVESVEE